MKKKTKEYQTFVLKDIFPEYKLKEYMNKIKNKLQKNSECDEEFANEFTERKQLVLHKWERFALFLKGR